MAAGRFRLAKKRLLDLTEAVHATMDLEGKLGFNEWIRAEDGTTRGPEGQTWSAAMYLYAAEAVDRMETPYFCGIRTRADTVVSKARHRS